MKKKTAPKQSAELAKYKAGISLYLQQEKQKHDAEIEQLNMALKKVMAEREEAVKKSREMRIKLESAVEFIDKIKTLLMASKSASDILANDDPWDYD